VAQGARAALLGAQDRKCLEQAPVSQQPKATRALQEIWMAETKTETAFDALMESYEVKYEKAAQCLAKDRAALLAVYDFPAEHWSKLVDAAQRSWRRLDGHALLPKLILGVKFADGLEVAPKNTDAQLNVAAT
jgi:hypothetical protein